MQLTISARDYSSRTIQLWEGARTVNSLLKYSSCLPFNCQNFVLRHLQMISNKS